ncbi:transporter substrate-binding domain-containing protein [Sphingomonas kaistensis]|uniref:Transporter substrate-binding domain-containing protein n=1 Tax=Sphingomonas kaistensis TaxID=298708 RepID=A0ABZ2G6I8_9SPHN
MLSRRAFVAGGLAAASTLSVSTAFAAPLRKVRETGVLKVAVYRDFAPWSWKEGEAFTGIDVDLGKALAARLGLKAEIMDFMADESADDDLRNMIWRGSLIGGGVADIMLHVPYDPQFAKQNDRVAIVAPYYREGFALACSREVDCEVPPPQFKGKRLAAELDSIPDFYLTGSFGGVLRGDVRHEMSAKAALDLIPADKADVVMASRAQVEFAMAQPSGKSFIPRKGPLPALPSAGWDVGIAVRDDSRDLGDAVEELIVAMRADRSLDPIFARYGVTPKAPLRG